MEENEEIKEREDVKEMKEMRRWERSSAAGQVYEVISRGLRKREKEGGSRRGEGKRRRMGRRQIPGLVREEEGGHVLMRPRGHVSTTWPRRKCLRDGGGHSIKGRPCVCQPGEEQGKEGGTGENEEWRKRGTEENK